MHLPDPKFPPLISGHPVNVPESPFDVACRRAAAGELGAADLVWSRSTASVDLALILEPDVDLSQSRQMYPLAFTALADSLGALMPPLTAVLLRWPSTLLINGGEAGKLRFAAGTDVEDQVPDWLVLGISISLQSAPDDPEPGRQGGRTTVFEEGGGDLDRSQILQSFAAHMLTWINEWQDDGFAAVHEQFIGRVEGQETPAVFPAGADGGPVRGKVLGLSDAMQLLVKCDTDGTVRTLSLAEALRSPS
ncbi:MAG: biotin/lipoate--protein ligase family protein [Alphaproteobacteria bacterium]|nr:biotin/lipoate--protein ligase family protein [Alphaproteobacteria bacterium]